MKILIVEDEHKIASSLKIGLEQESFVVDVSFDGRDGFDLASINEYDCLILDLMLPGLDGLSICQKLRQANNHVPILILTAKDNLQDKVTLLNSGADDYLTKPFAFAELLARLKALTRRPKNNLKMVLKYADLSLDPQNYHVTRAGRDIKLSKKEFSLLEFFLRHSEKILTKDQIINQVWNYDADVLPNTVEVYLRFLRRKIDLDFPELPKLLHTVRGFGYQLIQK